MLGSVHCLHLGRTSPAASISLLPDCARCCVFVSSRGTESTAGAVFLHIFQITVVQVTSFQLLNRHLRRNMWLLLADMPGLVSLFCKHKVLLWQ